MILRINMIVKQNGESGISLNFKYHGSDNIASLFHCFINSLLS